MKVYILAPNSTTNDEENINKVMDFFKNRGETIGLLWNRALLCSKNEL